MSSILIRRAEMQAKLDEYEDMVFGAGVGAIVLERCLVATPYLEIPSNCASITIHFSNTASMGLYNIRQQLYTATKAWGNYKVPTNYQSDFTFTLTAGQYSYLRATLDCDYLDDAYIKDNTNNTYLWKGKNVT